MMRQPQSICKVFTGLLPVLFASLFASLLTGCASIEASKSDLHSRLENVQFKHLDNPSAVEVSRHWWTEFSSEQLNHLMQQALSNNFDLQVTASRLEAAQASFDIEHASFFPSLFLNVGRQDNTVKGVSIQGQAANNRGLFTSAVLSASYEIDLWSKVRHLTQAAGFQVQASQYELEAAKISLAGQLATTWAHWVAAGQTVNLLEQELKLFESNLNMVEFRFRQGAALPINVLQQRQLLESAKGNLSRAISNRDVLLNNLSILVGQAPNTLNLSPEELPELPAIPATGIATELLNRRPDMQQAWALVLSANQSVAAAIANRFPQLSLRVTLGDQTRNSNQLFDNWVRNLSANLVAPLLDGGARSAQVDRQRALLDQAVAQYQLAAVNALADVDNALLQEARQREVLLSLQQQLELAEKSLKQLLTAYRNGTVDYLAILDVQQSTSQLRRNLVNTQQQLLSFRIALYRAISGSMTPVQETDPS